MDRRTAFFLIAAVVCAALIPVADHDLRWVPIAVSITYVVLAALVWLDDWSKRQEE